LLRDITKRIALPHSKANDNDEVVANVKSRYLPICPEHPDAIGKWHRDYKELEGRTGIPNYQGYYDRFPNEQDKDYRERINAAPHGYYYDGCMIPDLNPNETPEEERERIEAAENSPEARF
jgi:hypothetical protein